MKDVEGAGFAGSSPPFLGRERAAVDVVYIDDVYRILYSPPGHVTRYHLPTFLSSSILQVEKRTKTAVPKYPPWLGMGQEAQSAARAGLLRGLPAAAMSTILVLVMVWVGAGRESGGQPAELEPVQLQLGRQKHLHRVFDRLLKKPSSADEARAARARKHAIAKMSSEQARHLLMKWGFDPPLQTGDRRQALHQLHLQAMLKKALVSYGRLDHGTANGDNDPRHASAHVLQQRTSGKEKGAPPEEVGRAGFHDLENDAVSLARALQADQHGIIDQARKLKHDRKKLLQTRELIDRAISSIAVEPAAREAEQHTAVSNDQAFRNDDDQRWSTAMHRRPIASADDLWKIPIRADGSRDAKGPQAEQHRQRDTQHWLHQRRRRAPDFDKTGTGWSDVTAADRLALEEAASADGLQNVPASMASALLGNHPLSLESTADSYMDSVYARARDGSEVPSTLRSAQPRGVQLLRKARHMVDAMDGDASGSLVATYGRSYADGGSGQPYAAETPAKADLGADSAHLGETSAQIRRDSSYLAAVFRRG